MDNIIGEVTCHTVLGAIYSGVMGGIFLAKIILFDWLFYLPAGMGIGNICYMASGLVAA